METLLIIAILALIVGQFWLVTSYRRRLKHRMQAEINQAASQRSKLIEDAFDRQLGQK